MKENNVIRDKTYQFALKIVFCYKNLQENKKEYTLSRQLLRSGTSIGANIEESIGAQTDKDFFSKITISYKEARETHYWLRLLKDSSYLNKNEAYRLLQDVEEILRIISAIQKTLKSRI